MFLQLGEEDKFPIGLGLCAVVLYCALVTVAVLAGWQIKPVDRVLQGTLSMAIQFGSIVTGYLVEVWLRFLSGKKLLSARNEPGMPFVLGVAYVIPVVMALSGPVAPWFLPLSVVAFALIVFGIVWRWVRRTKR